ncbi:two-component system sensor histidine kinase NtrB [Aquibacillus albus]|uniref:histidine kinase n=1 Tax=Aquibacillus albus TaxID=1168171 RepID=A0ABS2MVU5_9BACI|nr:ATP-binding protein [Aquibacillus albus]MBM7570022.1 signal transduction histidine kinase [Aquibacillus albus]
MKKIPFLKGTKVYFIATSVTGISLFFWHDVFSATFQRISSVFGWILVILLIVACILSNRFRIILPPDGKNSLSMDSSIYIASTFIVGLEITLFLLFFSSLFDDWKQRRANWWNQSFNFAAFVLMISGAYYLFTFTGGEIGYIHLGSTVYYIISLVGYFFINIFLIGLYLWISLSINVRPLIKDAFIEALPNYVITFGIAFILALLLESNPFFGVTLFTVMIIMFSLIFKKYFRLYEKVSSDQKYREQILNSLPVGIITLDEKTNDITLNSSAVTLLNVSKEEVKENMTNPSNHTMDNRDFWNLLQTKKVFQNVKTSYRTKTKEEVLLASQSELKNQMDNIIGRIYFFIAVTEREELEKRMHQSEKLALLGELSAGAAHEIRNPLTVLQGFLMLIKESFPESEQNKFHLPFMLKEVDRINMIVEDMLLLSKPGELKLEEASIKGVIEEMVSYYKKSSDADKIQFHLDLDNTAVMLDTKQITQVMYNLIRNSSDAMEGKGTISIYSRVKHDTYQLFIQDTGSGIPEDLQQTIFDPFLTNKEAGTGLGLSIVQKIIENHQGKIELFSSSPKGTTFKITLPLTKGV